jgi:hypothetical protein
LKFFILSMDNYYMIACTIIGALVACSGLTSPPAPERAVEILTTNVPPFAASPDASSDVDRRGGIYVLASSPTGGPYGEFPKTSPVLSTIPQQIFGTIGGVPIDLIRAGLATPIVIVGGRNRR